METVRALRPIAVQSNQFYAEGLFHGFFKNWKGVTFAHVEDKYGNIHIYEVGTSYSFRFLDRPN